MKSVNNILEQGRFDVPDSGFSARVMLAINHTTQLQPKYSIAPRRVSAWLEFRLPMIGVAAGILLIGLLISNFVDMRSWGENYLQKTELMSQQLFSSPEARSDGEKKSCSETSSSDNIQAEPNEEY